MIFRIFLLISLALLFTVSARSSQIRLQKDPESAEFQAINSYLTGRDASSGETADVVTSLKEAMRTIETLGVDKFSKLGAENESETQVAIKYRSLIGSDPQVLLTIIKDLIWASSSCETTSLDFLSLVSERHTFNGQFLNQYTRRLVLNCWMYNLNMADYRVEKALGKMDDKLFVYLDGIASRVIQAKQRRNRNERGEIVINELQNINEVSKLKAIKELIFDKDQLKTIAKSIREIFEDFNGTDYSLDKTVKGRKNLETITGLRQFYKQLILSPCRELIRRTSQSLGPIFTITTRKLPADVTRKELGSKRQSNPNFDYHMETFRVCRELSLKEESILNLF